MTAQEVGYVRNEWGEATAVIVPIKFWTLMEAEQGSPCLLATAAKRPRLVEAMNRSGG
jgi:hypothetical protein